MEYIGVTAQYVEKLYIVDINNHRGVLPCDLVVVRQIVNGQVPMSSSLQTVRQHMNTHKDFKHRIFAGENTYSIQENMIITSFEKGEISVYYLGIKLDDEGFPMIPDTIRYSDALVWYVLMKVKQSELFSGRINPNEFEYYQTQWQSKAYQASSELSMPSPEEAYSLGKRFLRLIPNIQSHQEMYSSDNELNRYN
jgi:hypothetical protein